MPAKRCAYLEMAETDAWFENEKRWIPAFESIDWSVTAVRWLEESPDWDGFDAVYIGYPWDYPEHPQQFLQCLSDRIDLLLRQQIPGTGALALTSSASDDAL